MPLQRCETQTRIPVNLGAASLPGDLFTEQTEDKPSLVRLYSHMQVSGLGDESTKACVRLFITAQETDYGPLPCFYLQGKVKSYLDILCILTVSLDEEKNSISALPK